MTSRNKLKRHFNKHKTKNSVNSKCANKQPCKRNKLSSSNKLNSSSKHKQHSLPKAPMTHSARSAFSNRKETTREQPIYLSK